MLAGNLASIGVGGIVSVVYSYFVSRTPHITSLQTFLNTDTHPETREFRL